MSMNTCDIIIPAYNNADTLPQTLAALREQRIPPKWQVRILVCDDGSEDNSIAKVQEFSADTQTDIQTLLLPGDHRGAAAARNRGIRTTRADIIIFLGADICLRPGAIAAHLLFHTENPDTKAGALGFVMWDPRLHPTPLMEWMMHGGPQNNFDDLLDRPATVPFFGSHVSIKRAALGDELFCEDFTTYGWEDSEMGQRLKQRGLQLQPLPSAIGLHRHFYSADNVFARQYMVGVGHYLFCALTGHTTPPIRLRHRLQQLLYAAGIGKVLRTCVRALAPRYAAPRLFAHMANYEYRRGLFHTRTTSYPQGFTQ